MANNSEPLLQYGAGSQAKILVGLTWKAPVGLVLDVASASAAQLVCNGRAASSPLFCVRQFISTEATNARCSLVSVKPAFYGHRPPAVSARYSVWRLTLLFFLSFFLSFSLFN